jgi:hypothetical protein
MPRPSISRDERVHGRTVDVVSSHSLSSPTLDDPIARQRIVLQYRVVKAILKFVQNEPTLTLTFSFSILNSHSPPHL